MSILKYKLIVPTVGVGVIFIAMDMVFTLPNNFHSIALFRCTWNVLSHSVTNVSDRDIHFVPTRPVVLKRRAAAIMFSFVVKIIF